MSDEFDLWGLDVDDAGSSRASVSPVDDAPVPEPAVSSVDDTAFVELAVADWAEVSAEMGQAQNRAADLGGGEQFVHQGEGGVMDSEDVAATLRLLRAAPETVKAVQPEALKARAEALGLTTPDGFAYTAVTALDLLDKRFDLTVSTGSAVADRQTAKGDAEELARRLWLSAGVPIERAEAAPDGRVVLSSKPGQVRGVVAREMLRKRLPKLAALGEVGDIAAWKRAVIEASLYVEDRQPSGALRRQAPQPLGWHLARSGEPGVRFKTPPRVTLSMWERSLPVLRTLLGDEHLRVEQLTAEEVGLFPGRATAKPSPYIPTARELTHVAAAPGEVEARAAALAAYNSSRWILGRTPDGEVLGDLMRFAPHALVAGGTGAGKTTWVAWLATTLVSAGGDVIICDGKASSGYDGLVRDLPNCLLLTKQPAEHVAALQWLSDEMDARYKTIRKRALAGKSDYPMRPLTLIFDEYGAFKDVLTNGDAGALSADLPLIDSLVTTLLQKSREARIHLVFVSQTIYGETLPGKQKGNIPVRLSLGVPSMKTLQEVAAGAYDDAAVVAKTIPRGKPGLGISMAEVNGENVAALVSVPYGFVPGRTDPNPEVEAIWQQTDREAFRGLKVLTPRIALVYDAPVEVADRGKKAPAPATWMDYGLHEIRQLPWVRVTPWRGRDPIPGASKYDVLSEDYAGDDVTTTGGKYH